MTGKEKMIRILCDALDGCPLTYPCDKLWSPEGWCKDHCKPGQTEPDAECWLKYAEVMTSEALRTKDVPDTNVGDMISRAEAMDAFDRIFDRCEEIEAHLPEGDPDRTGYKMYPDYMTVWKYLHQLPSAQSEIIRCKDCKNIWRSGTATIKEVPTKIYRCKLWDRAVSEKGFCYMAERRTDESDKQTD